MSTRGYRATAIVVCAALLLGFRCEAQSAPETPPHVLPNPDDAGLDSVRKTELQRALDTHDFVRAEGILLPQIEHAALPAEKYRLLLTIASVYSLNHDDLNAAIAWKKAEAISPLPEPLQFSLAMAYIGMGRRDWAATQLQELADTHSKNAMYPYWLGRLDYDRQAYSAAISHFQHAIQLDPSMARAYDNLGLCQSYLGDSAHAIENFKKAITLDSHATHPSPWPYINLAAALQTTGDLTGAETNLQEAIHLDTNFAPTHFQLGNVLDSMDRPQAAVDEYLKAAKLDPHYAEPHFALARLYRRMGKDELARQEVAIYTQLHGKSAPQ
ncbi:tetratricopeptide repeat protein [Silvibacterium sp.]|uniref:tetratricopeptide repeat protein n=1 Tax=Silvibacterium sp. TaxID=1964179 RepID=UPI0039E319F1